MYSKGNLIWFPLTIQRCLPNVMVDYFSLCGHIICWSNLFESTSLERFHFYEHWPVRLQGNFSLSLSVAFSLIISIEVKAKTHFIKRGELREKQRWLTKAQGSWLMLNKSRLCSEPQLPNLKTGMKQKALQLWRLTSEQYWTKIMDLFKIWGKKRSKQIRSWRGRRDK